MNIMHQPEYYQQRFEKLDYSNEEISSIIFENCTFINVIFQNTNFQNCRFDACKFELCDLSLSKVNDTSYCNVSFIDSKISGVNWEKQSRSNLKINSGFLFQNSILDFSSFYNLYLPNTTFSNCEIQNVDFGKANLSNSSFQGSNLANSIFEETDLTKCDFREAKSYNISINSNKLTGAKFSYPEVLGLFDGLGIEVF